MHTKEDIDMLAGQIIAYRRMIKEATRAEKAAIKRVLELIKEDGYDPDILNSASLSGESYLVNVERTITYRVDVIDTPKESIEEKLLKYYSEKKELVITESMLQDLPPQLRDHVYSHKKSRKLVGEWRAKVTETGDQDD